ncbi:MAG: AEC family transporter [Rhizobiales bacterium]|nr:AEC family transporter [Hyphomicrobiales bacterium]
MDAILNSVLPVFGIIALGFIFAKLRLVSEGTARGLTQFVFLLAIPALLFRTVVMMPPQEVKPWGLWIAMFGGLAIVWMLAAIIAQRTESLSASGGAAASMAAGFGNVALLGTPLALAHYGKDAAVPAGLILSIHAVILWLAATLHREFAVHAEQVIWRSIGRELLKTLSTNAIIIALAAAGIWRFVGLGLHPIPDRMLEMLSDASIPSALFALGLSLATYSLRGQWGGVGILIVLKMAVAPLMVYGLLRLLGPIPDLWFKVAVVFAAMPTGANAFLFAHRNEEAVAPVSASIALGTALAAITVSVLLYALDSGMI